LPLVTVYGSTGAQRAPCAAPAARAAPGTAPFAAPAFGEQPPAAARAARAALRDYCRRARAQPRRARRLASAGSPPRRVLPQRRRAGAPRLSGRPPASRQSAWGAPGAGRPRRAPRAGVLRNFLVVWSEKSKKCCVVQGPRLAPATPRRRAPPLGASSRVPPVGLGRAGGGRCKGCAWCAALHLS